jgi:mono/diheme cytochrome c family protein
MGWRNLLLSTMALAACAVATGQSPTYKLGKTPSVEEVRTFDPWDPISNEGKELPAGSGTAAAGEKIYAQKCSMCHGNNLVGGEAPALVKDPSGKQRFAPFPVQVPFATVVWDYIRRAMPMLIGAGTLKSDEVYSLTAFLLYKNAVIKENDVLDAQTLPKVKMPKRDEFVSPVVKPWKP